jgi:hypothetical protein
MGFRKYEREIDPLCPVAMKLGQTDVHAPAHDTWGVVMCETCRVEFLIGPHRIRGSRIGAEECAQRLEGLLAEDHKMTRAHHNSYEIPD